MFLHRSRTPLHGWGADIQLPPTESAIYRLDALKERVLSLASHQMSPRCFRSFSCVASEYDVVGGTRFLVSRQSTTLLVEHVFLCRVKVRRCWWNTFSCVASEYDVVGGTRLLVSRQSTTLLVEHVFLCRVRVRRCWWNTFSCVASEYDVVGGTLPPVELLHVVAEHARHEAVDERIDDGAEQDEEVDDGHRHRHAALRHPQRQPTEDEHHRDHEQHPHATHPPRPAARHAHALSHPLVLAGGGATAGGATGSSVEPLLLRMRLCEWRQRDAQREDGAARAHAQTDDARHQRVHRDDD